MSNSNTHVCLSVEDNTGFLSILDGQLQTLVTDFGLLEAQLSPGIYKAVCRLGNKTEQKLFILPKFDEVKGKNKQRINIDFKKLDFVPEEENMIAALKTMNLNDIPRVCVHTEGQCSELLIGVHFHASDSENSNTIKGISVYSAKNLLLADLNNEDLLLGIVDNNCFVRLKLQSGNYRVKYDYGRNEGISRPVILSSTGGMLLLTQSMSKRHQSDLAQATFYPADINYCLGWCPSWFKLNHVVSNSLALRTNLSKKNERILMLDEKFDNPILGLFVAHLMLLDASTNLDLLRKVIENLHYIFRKDNHPDVVALMLGYNQRESKLVDHFNIPEVDFPPLLVASWKILVEQANETPALFSAASLCWEMMDKVVDTDLWLTWKSITQPETNQAQHQTLSKALKQVVPIELRSLASKFGLSPNLGLYSDLHLKALGARRMFSQAKIAVPQLLKANIAPAEVQSTLPVKIIETKPTRVTEDKRKARNRDKQQLESGLLSLTQNIPWPELIRYVEAKVKSGEFVLTPLQDKILAALVTESSKMVAYQSATNNFWQRLRKELSVTEAMLIDNAIDLAKKVKVLSHQV